jgi:hypothetical protein
MTSSCAGLPAGAASTLYWRLTGRADAGDVMPDGTPQVYFLSFAGSSMVFWEYFRCSPNNFSCTARPVTATMTNTMIVKKSRILEPG